MDERMVWISLALNALAQPFRRASNASVSMSSGSLTAIESLSFVYAYVCARHSVIYLSATWLAFVRIVHISGLWTLLVTPTDDTCSPKNNSSNTKEKHLNKPYKYRSLFILLICLLS